MTTRPGFPEEALRDLDPADRELSQAQRDRATAILERIVTTDPEEPPPAAAPVHAPRRRTRRLLLAGSAAVLVAAAAVALPSVLERDGQAFASWSPTPVELTGSERAEVTEACLALHGDETGELEIPSGAVARTLVAEARGGWSYVVLRVAGAAGAELQGSCLLPDALVADPRPGEGGYFGSLGRADEESAVPAPGRDVARVESTGAGSVDGELFVFVEGRSGADVIGIEVTTPTGTEVQASVTGGRWAAWWPAGEPAMDNPEIAGAPTYEVTLRDGTVTDEVRD